MRYINPSDQDIVEWLPGTLPDRRIRYGSDPLQFGDLRLPAGPAPDGGYPVAIVLHGGGYSPNWGLDNVARLAESLTTVGAVVTWNLEYRRPGQIGGGWPGTWIDIAEGIDHLRAIAPRYQLDLDRTVAVGHSAGGTFAVWAAARESIPEGSDLYVPDPLELRGVVSLAGILDLARQVDDHGSPPRNLKALLSDQDSETGGFEAHLAEVTPMSLAHRSRASQRLIVGSLDADVMIEQTRRFDETLDRDEHPVGAQYLNGANHFDLIDPRGAAWLAVAGAVFALLDIDLPAENLQAPHYDDAR